MTVVQDDILKVTATLTLPGTNLMQNVYYVQFVDPVSVTDTAAVLALRNWCDALYDLVEDHLNEDVALSEVAVSRFVSGTPGTWLDIGSLAGTAVGLAIGETLPDGVALVIRAATGVAKTLGRKFLGGLVESAVNEQAWEANVVTDALLYLTRWFEGPASPAGDYISGVFSSVLQDFVQFKAEGAVSTIPGYQRRRKPGVGI